MKKTVKSILSIIATMLFVSIFVFIVQSLTLGDSSSYILSEDISEGEIALYRSANGLDRNISSRYFSFMRSFFSMDWGKTISGHDIKEIIGSRFPITIAIAIFSLLLSLMIAIPLSILSASKREGIADRVLSSFSIVMLSLPSFLVALLLILVFSFHLKLFPIAGYIQSGNSISGFLCSLFLPSLTLALVNSAFLMRMFRECLIDNLDKPYTLALKAQGADGVSLVVYSALKPSIPVLISLIVQNVASALSGSAIVESVFAIPGMGSLLVKSVLSRDIRLSGTIIMLIAFIVSILFLISDLVSIYVEPRLRRR